ncbi:hypothetical protein E2562_014304 [Oryza meyeriana var. granulata]|uniref:Uncharacterized protein n=1 Tax=Oryza meyeriana var. granulata TaxID=110450 RepID=A0A6G1C4V3_9ORYZ|nr:hypothetical protein E2562_014304 [Oryza meyeriana var. granulata]
MAGRRTLWPAGRGSSSPVGTGWSGLGLTASAGSATGHRAASGCMDAVVESPLVGDSRRRRGVRRQRRRPSGASGSSVSGGRREECQPRHSAVP